MPSRPRRLRQQATRAEQALWQRLRDRQVEGFKFRRQEPVGPFVADFLCYEARLIVEVDGGQHGQDRQERKDAARTVRLCQDGFTVVRYGNNDVLENIDGVVADLAARLKRKES